MTSTAVKIGNSAEEVAARMPGDREMRIISPEDAKILFGAGANRVEGVTVRLAFCLFGPTNLKRSLSVARQRSTTIVRLFRSL